MNASQNHPNKIMPLLLMMTIGASVIFAPQSLAAFQDFVTPTPHQIKRSNDNPCPIGNQWNWEGTDDAAWKKHLLVFEAAAKRIVQANPTWTKTGGENLTLVASIDESMRAEEYRLVITSNQIRIIAAKLKGLAHASATLLQLIGSSTDGTIAACEIADRPSCSYRNFMVDLGRNPHSLGCLKETIDLLWFYKVDSIHLHLTDDQRFAFPSRAYPKLATKDGLITWEQFAELEDYAQLRGVTIIPELEVPGHSSLLRRHYPDVFGKTSTDLAKLESAKTGIKVLLDEMIELFPSSPYIHIGGDEAFGVPDDLQRELINELHEYLKSKGKRTIVWEGPPLGEGDNKVNTEVIQINWRTINFPADRMLAAGYPVVNAAWDPLYIVDHYPRNNFTMATPQHIFESLKLEKFQHFNPGIPTFERPIQTGANQSLIGFCMPWWEGREENYAAMCFPRIIPMAEIAWNHEQARKSEKFEQKTKLAEQTRRQAFYPIEISTESLAVPADGVFHETTTVTLKKRGNEIGDIKFTLDGTAPRAESKTFEAALELDATTTVRAALFKNGSQVALDSRKKLTQVKPTPNLALGKPVHSNRTSGAPFSVERLTDGGTGKLDYYLAYPAEPEPCQVTVDLESVQQINQVSVHAFSNQRAYESYRVLISKDGVEFEEVASRLDKPDTHSQKVDHKFDPTDVRFVRVESSGCKQNVFAAFSRLIEIQVFNN